jgi:hypothetical protein
MPATEKPRRAKHETGLVITSEAPSKAGLVHEGFASLGTVWFLVRAVWSDQFALPNRAFALRLRLE